MCEDALSFIRGAPLILERYLDIQQYFSHPKLTGSEKALPINMKLRLYQTQLRLLIAIHLNQSIYLANQEQVLDYWASHFNCLKYAKLLTVKCYLFKTSFC